MGDANTVATWITPICEGDANCEGAAAELQSCVRGNLNCSAENFKGNFNGNFKGNFNGNFKGDLPTCGFR